MTFRAGATLARTFVIKDAAGAFIDVTGWTSEAAVRLTDRFGVPLTGTPALQATSTYDATAHSFTLDFPVSVSVNLQPTSGGLALGVNYVWDWKLTTPAGKVYVPLAGIVTVLRKAT